MQVEKISRSQVLNNSAWKFFESIGSSVVNFLITVFLARLLSPDDYGLMAIVLVVISFMGLFVNSGISSYLVFIKDIRKEDFLTVLVCNLVVSLVLMATLLLLSTKIADYYSAPSLSSLICTMSIALPFNAVSSVYNAYAIKFSQFRTLFVRNMIAFPVSGVVALAMAYWGFGVWALVAQQLISSILLAVILALSIRIEIDGRWVFQGKQCGPMIKYGVYVLFASIVAFISDNISDLLIGKKISPQKLGYYNRGGYYPNAVVNIANNVLTGVLFPAFVSYNSNLIELKAKFRKTVRMLYYIVFPMFLGLIACSKPLILFTVSDKWAASIPVMQIICVYYMAIPFLQTGSQACLATGAVRLRMVGEIFKMVITLPLLFLFVSHGIEAVACARVLVNVFMVVYSMFLNKKIMNYGYLEFLRDMMKPLAIGLLVALCIYPLAYLQINCGMVLALQGVVGVSIYFLCMKVMKIEEMEEITSIVLKRLKIKK